MTDLYHYFAYGMHIASNEPVRSLMPAVARSSDLTLQFIYQKELVDEPEGHCVYRTTGSNATGAPFLEVQTANVAGDEPWILKHRSDKGAIDFILHAEPKSIEIRVQSGTPAEDIEAYLTGAALGHFLRLCGKSCLHGGFLSWKGQAIGVVGPKGAGKSTLTAGWARQGVPVLADDVGCLKLSGDEWEVSSAYPRIRLWPPTFDGLGLRQDHRLGDVMSFADKVYVDLEDAPFQFESRPRPLGAILVLAPRSDGDLTLTPLTGAAALAALLGQIYAPHAGGRPARKRDVMVLTDVCKRVPVFRVSLPDTFDWLRHDSLKLLDLIL